MTDLGTGCRATSTRRRRVLNAVATTAAVTALATASGCSGGDEAGPIGDPTVITLSAVDDDAVGSTAATPDPAVPPTAATASVAIDAPALLQSALADLAAGHHVRTTVTVAGSEVLVAEGDTVGDGARLTIWANGTSVAYVVTPTGTWVFPEGGEWEPLDTPPATTDPLLALRAPIGVTGTSSDGVTATLVATVTATSLGVPTEGTAQVVVELDGSSVTEMSYVATVDGRTATVRSVFGAVLDPSPVVAPI